MNFETNPQFSKEKAGALSEAHQKGILAQIENADIEMLDEVLENIAEAVYNNPDLFKDPETLQKINAAHERFKKLTGLTDESEILH